MDQTSRNRFRTDDDVNQWLVIAWNMISGRFYPANEKRRGMDYTILPQYLDQICNTILQQSSPMVSLSETETSPETDRCFLEVAGAFDKLLPDKSSFEK